MLIDIATSTPPFRVDQTKASEELKIRMSAGRAAVGRLLDAAAQHSGIDSRNVTLLKSDNEVDTVFFPTEAPPLTRERMNRYEECSKDLAFSAVGELLGRNNIDPSSIGRVITITCTGFYAPGLDYYIIEKFNLPRTVKRTSIGFMGCAASVIGFSNALEAIRSGWNGAQYILMVSLELCSLHLQFEPTKDNILANTIFSDGCAAVLLGGKGADNGKLELLDTASIIFDSSEGMMGWKIGNLGFEMKLSSELPDRILNSAVPALKNILKDMNIDRVDHWVLHPGGRAILDALKQGLDLSEEQMACSREVLRKYGNMSSASILFVMQELLASKAVKPGDIVCTVAFGPGLSMETAVFRGV